MTLSSRKALLNQRSTGFPDLQSDVVIAELKVVWTKPGLQSHDHVAGSSTSWRSFLHKPRHLFFVCHGKVYVRPNYLNPLVSDDIVNLLCVRIVSYAMVYADG